MAAADGAASGSRGGFALLGLGVGLAAGAAAAALSTRSGPVLEAPATGALIFFIGAVAALFLLIADRGKVLRALVPAVAIAALLTGPTYYMLLGSAEAGALGQFPVLFWLAIGAPASALLLIALARAALEERLPPPYRAVFIEGLTLPFIFAGALVVAGLAALFLFALGALLEGVGAGAAARTLSRPIVLFPFFGAVSGFSIALMRSLDATLGALRYAALLACRFAMPVIAAAALAMLALLLVNGVGAFLARPYPGVMSLVLCLSALLAFNGVYQNGEGEPPPAWLRLSADVSILAAPLFAALAIAAFWMRIEQYGLTPARLAGATIAGLAGLYSLASFASLITELNWKSRRWLPLIAPFNALMATVWAGALIALATPLADPWAISAKDQEQAVLDGRISAERFDYDHLAHRLGPAGRAALDRLSAIGVEHKEAGEIRVRAARALAALSPAGAPPSAIAPAGVAERPAAPGPLDLDFRPEGADLGDDPPPVNQPAPE